MTDHELLPVAWHVDLPAGVAAALLDLGIACNDAARACDHAVHLQRSAQAAAEAATVGTPNGRFRQHTADLAVRCALSYTEQLAVAYTVVAATNSVAAASAAASIGSDQPVTSPDAVLVAPSRVLADPRTHLPLIAMPTSGTDAAISDHNGQLVAAHQRLLRAVTDVGSVLECYDAPQRVAARPDGAVDLSLELPDALHAYGAACCWAIGLVRRQP